ncbi:MAG: hypothetical protein Q9186_005107 [Xanthomendoza sp. 1 TL-2023]
MAFSLPPGTSLDMIPSIPPPTGIQSNFLHPVTLRKEIVAVSVVTSVLAVTLLCTRLYTTLRITRSAWYDDIASLFATVFSLAYVALIIHTRDHSRHGWDLPISAFTSSFFKIILAETIISAFSILLSKISILLLLYRLFAPDQRFRHFIYIGLVWATLIFCTSLVVAFVLCVPRPGEAFSSLQVVQRCTHQEIWAVVQGPLNVLLDFYILYIPIPIIWNLKMGQRRKFGVIAIFMTGFIACLASILSLAFKVKLLASSDTLFNSFRVDILNIVETNAAIMVACMPACASFRRFFSSKSEFLSALKIRLLSVRSSLSRGGRSSSNTKDSSNAMNMVGAGEPQLKSGTSTKQAGRYWKLKNGSPSEKNSLPPQITANKERSPSLASARLSTTDWSLASGHVKKSENLGSSQEDEETLSSSPHKMV